MAQITYKNIYDLITEAKKQCATPVELTIDENVQLPCLDLSICDLNNHIGHFVINPIRDYVVTIRFRQQ